MTTMAPYRENRFQGFARRFGEFYYATSLRPLAFIGSIWLAYMVIWTVLRSTGHAEAAFYATIVYFVVLIGVLAFAAYGLRQKWRKRDYEFQQRMMQDRVEFEATMAEIDARFEEMIRRTRRGSTVDNSGHEVIESKVIDTSDAGHDSI